MHDITSQVAAIVERSDIRTGTVNVFNVGSTGAVGTIEFEPGLQRDLPEILDRLMPPNTDYGHEQAWHDGNGHSHIGASIIGPSLTIPFVGGNLTLGTWQQIVFCDFDNGPRKRKLEILLLGE